MQSINNFLFSNPKLSWFWLIVRVYVGYEWIMAGYEKIINPAWVGSSAGGAITGFVNGALAKTAGAHPDVSEWYAWFLTHAVLPNANLWSHAVAYGELAVGLGLIFGVLTFWAAFFGFFMNLNYLLAGTVSTNPVLLVLALLIMLAHRVAGRIGFDYYIFKNRFS
ncbi:MAG TPA: DoxX family protein [Candidatus Paceibacterota bacterium]